MKYKKNKTKKSPAFYKKPVVLVLLVAVIIAAGLVYWVNRTPDNPKPTYKKTSTGYDVNLSPPTKQEQQQGDVNKQQITKDEAQNGTDTNPPPGGSVAADPFITYAAQEGPTIVVRGYVGGVFEDNGTCTITFTKGSLKVTSTAKGFEDSNHVTCPPINTPRSNFSEAGTWTATLSYSSDKATGTSQSRNVVIQ